MKPITKAKELFKKYSKGRDEHGWALCEFDSCARICALIAVDEIIKSGPSYPYDIQFDSMPHFRSLKYWKEVKQEIEKL